MRGYLLRFASVTCGKRGRQYSARTLKLRPLFALLPTLALTLALPKLTACASDNPAAADPGVNTDDGGTGEGSVPPPGNGEAGPCSSNGRWRKARGEYDPWHPKRVALEFGK